MKKSLLAKTVVLGLMTATVWSFALDAQAKVWVDHNGINDVAIETSQATGSVVTDINLTHQNLDINGNVEGSFHPVGEDENCEISADKLTIGQIAAVKDVLVENDKALETKANAAQATADKAKEQIAQEKSERIAADKKEKSERIAEDTRIEQKFDKEVSRLDSKIDKLDGRIEKVGAMSAAIANLHTMGYDPAAPTEIAVGVGQYRDKTGLALGAFHYPNRDFMMSFSVSTAGDEFMAGIGATWKIGRKSPEQMLKAQQEKAARERLAEAEAMKQAAKDARVAAQQARHAKMLAERSK